MRFYKLKDNGDFKLVKQRFGAYSKKEKSNFYVSLALPIMLIIYLILNFEILLDLVMDINDLIYNFILANINAVIANILVVVLIILCIPLSILRTALLGSLINPLVQVSPLPQIKMRCFSMQIRKNWTIMV